MINQRRAFSNFMELLNPGGIVLIEHRNYDEILRTGVVQANNVSLAVSESLIFFNLNNKQTQQLLVHQIHL